MDRRKSIKSIVLGSVAGGLALKGCNTAPEEIEQSVTQANKFYGRTPMERERDEAIASKTFFNDHQRETMVALCDLILPPSEEFKGASDADVVSFIDFMAFDGEVENENLQTDLRGGLMWLDHTSNDLYEVDFKSATAEQQKAILDKIAYYNPEEKWDERPFEVNFFSIVRNLTMTGFYTSKIGIEELGYKGNQPNVWDGVPEDVLAQHGVAYEPEWLAKCVDQSKRNIKAEWDDNGNLLT